MSGPREAEASFVGHANIYDEALADSRAAEAAIQGAFRQASFCLGSQEHWQATSMALTFERTAEDDAIVRGTVLATLVTALTAEGSTRSGSVDTPS